MMNKYENIKHILSLSKPVNFGFWLQFVFQCWSLYNPTICGQNRCMPLPNNKTRKEKVSERDFTSTDILHLI